MRNVRICLWLEAALDLAIYIDLTTSLSLRRIRDPAMISSNDFRPGVTIEYNNGVWVIVESMHVKPGKGSAFVRTKMKNIETGNVLEQTFRAGEKLPSA